MAARRACRVDLLRRRRALDDACGRFTRPIADALLHFAWVGPTGWPPTRGPARHLRARRAMDVYGAFLAFERAGASTRNDVQSAA